jgi:hypothetical protein
MRALVDASSSGFFAARDDDFFLFFLGPGVRGGRALPPDRLTEFKMERSSSSWASIAAAAWMV